MPRGASPKRERQYEHIKQSAKKSGRYGGRAEEVAARTVNKIRREKGETTSRRSRSKKSSSTSGATKARSTKSRSSKPRATKSRAGAGRSRRAARTGRGFAGMSLQRQRAIAAEGGRAAHKQGTAHEFSRAEAREAGQKGGEAVSRDRSHMAEIGRRGGAR
jgi:uncharacterized protein